MLFLNKINDVPEARQTRPITMLSHSLKFFEEALKSGLTDYLKRNPNLLVDQFGFKE